MSCDKLRACCDQTRDLTKHCNSVVDFVGQMHDHCCRYDLILTNNCVIIRVCCLVGTLIYGKEDFLSVVGKKIATCPTGVSWIQKLAPTIRMVCCPSVLVEEDTFEKMNEQS